MKIEEMKVVKRDGRIVRFDMSKIIRAVSKAYAELKIELDQKTIEDLTAFFTKIVEKSKTDSLDIEDIQDSIRNFLMNKKKYDVAEAFIIYRENRSNRRRARSKLHKEIADKLHARNIVNQNANVDENSFGGRQGEVTRAVTKDYALKNCMSKKSRDNHNNNEVYIHDLDSYAVGMHNCLSIPFDDLLANGFRVRQTDVRPANSINTAFQLVAVIFQLQSLQQFGGVSATHLDWTMVPYVRKSFTKHLGDGMQYLEGKSEYKVKRFHKWLENDPKHPDGTIHFDDVEFKELHPAAWEYAMDMTERETYQAVEGMYHNLNTLQSRSGNQLPFTSINYGTCTLEEGRLVTRAILNVSIEGIGALHRTPIFPCGIYQKMKGVNDKGSKNYDLYRLALQSTAKRIYPNYANCDWSCQTSWVEKDRHDRQQYIDSLPESDYNRLIAAIEENPELGIILDLEIVNE